MGGGASGHFKGTKGSENKLPTNHSVLKHIFRDKQGHMMDTEKNRLLLETTANSKESYLGKDKYGNEWYAKIFESGKQVWVEVRNGKIIDGGLNNRPKSWNDGTGLKKE